jgi:hypothetical protein
MMKTFKLSKLALLSGLTVMLSASAFADPSMPDPALPMIVTPAVTGPQRVLVVGCRFGDTLHPDLLDFANSGIRAILQNTHNYFDLVSNHRVDLQGEFEAWHDLPKSSGDYGTDGAEATKDCQDIARQVVVNRGQSVRDYRSVVLLFNRDLGFASATGQFNGDPGTYTRLRFSGGTGGGWTSEALWAHELGHAFGLLHSTFPVRADGNQYNDAQDAMSGFALSAQERWNFPAGGVCNGITAHPRCIYSGEGDQMPVHYSAFQKQRLGWLAPDQLVSHWGGTTTYRLSAPTSAPNDDSTLRRLKMVHVKIANSNAYYAIEYRRGYVNGEDTGAGERRGWDAVYEKGMRSDRVTVYYVEPDLYNSNAGDLGDANLVAVLNPNALFEAPADKPRLTVGFIQVDDATRMTASVIVTAPDAPPPRTLLFAAGADGRWVNQDVSATLSVAPGAPIAKTYYGVDDRGCNETTLDCAFYGDAFTIAGEGTHDVTYFSTDVTGQAEPAQHSTVRIDKTPPTTTASVASAGAGIQFTLAATDTLSGVGFTGYQIDGAGEQSYQGPVVVTAPGAHTVRIRSVDNAGNSETVQSLALQVPSLPLSATAMAMPSSITRANGRAVNVHVALRTDTPGSSLRLTKVSHTGKGRERGWKLETADVDGVVYAIKGVTYTLTYTVTDPAGRTAQAEARLVVGN